MTGTCRGDGILVTSCICPGRRCGRESGSAGCRAFIGVAVDSPCSVGSGSSPSREPSWWERNLLFALLEVEEKLTFWLDAQQQLVVTVPLSPDQAERLAPGLASLRDVEPMAGYDGSDLSDS